MSTKLTENGYAIVLMKDNHKPWLQFIKSRLRAKGLWSACDTATTAKAEDKEKAHGLITQFMNEEYRAMVDSENSPAAVLDVIKKHFKISMPTRRELFDTELRNFKWNGKCVDKNAERYQSVLRKFIGNDGSKTDHQYAMDFIRHAPEPYSTVIGQYQALEFVTLLKVTEGLRRIQLQKAISEDFSNDGKKGNSHALHTDGAKSNLTCFSARNVDT